MSLLNATDLHVDTSASVREALDAAFRHSPDVLISELAMPTKTLTHYEHDES